ncbi:GNAT family N-acetyltransferase [Periweissella ghanensis]|uniref:N-acetyltransferase domain-containing protein n=1 Tax=Periweissella ghanensis TaxID=467997 RepID=A0ABM8ZCL9_9LACO|nr:GNAT family N-acetyltransferase [Periweissella ghanensis]MCM0600370.1 GNAT family N-acetyltransferase [Periweissella ghanensis]CAH0419318.1 hypothetical protein WGH24286_01766 [Periweissella ghanensis]
MEIRPARLTDQASISRLILTIIDQMALTELQTMDVTEKLAVLSKGYNLQKLLAYTNVIVAEIDGIVAGMSYSYAADVEMQTRTDILAGTNGIDLHPNQEAWPNEWYLEMLSVDENYRGHGIGQALMMATTTLAHAEGFTKISLNVDNENPRAEKLYLKQAFVTEKQIMIGDHKYKHMVKTLN